MNATNRQNMLKVRENVELWYEKNPVDQPKAVAIIVHGLCEHAGRYDYAVSRLNAFGYSVYRFDNSGHGRSGGKRASIENYRHFIDDADKIVDLAGKENPGIPLFMLGHSMGGFITASYGINRPGRLSGQILSGAAVMVLPMVQGMEDFDFNATPDVPIPNDLSDLVSRDPAVVQAYKDDPLVLKEFTMKLMGEVFIRGAKDVMAGMASYRYPCLILHGGGDQIVTPDASKYFFEHISSTDKELKIYDGLYHEILNEPEKDAVLEDVHRWIDKRIKP